MTPTTKEGQRAELHSASSGSVREGSEMNSQAVLELVLEQAELFAAEAAA